MIVLSIRKKEIAIGTHTAVIYANLEFGYLEVKLFNKLPEIFFYDMVEFFLKNYFRFLNDVKYKWKERIEVSPLGVIQKVRSSCKWEGGGGAGP